MKKTKVDVRRLTEMAMLVAIEIIMFYTPLGMLPLPGQYASLLTVPVAVGAMILGPAAGGTLAAIFGLLSFWKAMQTGTLLSAGVSVLAIFALCVPTRMLMGICTGWLFRLYKKLDKTNTVCYFLGGVSAPLLNTLFYMTAYVIILFNAPLLQNVVANAMGEEVLALLKSNVLLFVAAYVGVQALVEAGVGCVVSGLVSKALSKVMKRK